MTRCRLAARELMSLLFSLLGVVNGAFEIALFAGFSAVFLEVCDVNNDEKEDRSKRKKGANNHEGGVVP